MQLAGALLIVLGLLTKCAAIMATIPEPIVGGVLGAGIVMVTGVSLSNLEVTLFCCLTRSYSGDRLPLVKEPFHHGVGHRGWRWDSSSL